MYCIYKKTKFLSANRIKNEYKLIPSTYRRSLRGGTLLTLEILFPVQRAQSETRNVATYLFLLLIEIVNNDPHKKIQSEKRAKDDENHKVDVHILAVLPFWLTLNLQKMKDRDVAFRLGCFVFFKKILFIASQELC